MQDIILKVAIESLLESRSKKITLDDIAKERTLLWTSIPEVEQRVFDDMLEAKGFGEFRQHQLLWRNAALRQLIAEDVVVTNDAVKRMYAIIHGPKYPAKIIVVTTLDQASEIKMKLEEGVPFSDLAVKMSIDSSAVLGGIVNPISMADPAWPSSIRETLPRIDVGVVSNPILIGDRWVLLTVTGSPTKQEVEFDEVEPTMRQLAQLTQERFLMEKLRVSLIQQYTPVLFDADFRRVLGSDTGNPK